MEEKWKQRILSLVMSVMLPGTLLHFGGSVEKTAVTETAPSQPEVTVPQQLPVFRMAIRMGEQISLMEPEEYIVGVVLAEMPPFFEPEALKAQAIAARTYAYRCYVAGDKHDDAAVCTDFTCCQAYISPRDYLNDGGTEGEVEKVRDAVRDTAGTIMTYEGALIDAAYFSCSGGKTEDAAAVWGADVPYLRSVDSPGEEIAEHYRDRVFFSVWELEERLGRSLYGSSESWLGSMIYTDGGGVETVCFAGEYYTGAELRGLLGLNSTAFFLEAADDGVYVLTSGKGHRVGMSQWGAQAMALAGADYAQILIHYYSGIAIDKIENIL